MINDTEGIGKYDVNYLEYNGNGITLASSYDNSILYNSIFGYQTCILGNLVDNIVSNNSLHWTDLAPILIDQTDTSKNWTYSSENYDWCSGNDKDGYRIENATINGEGSVVILLTSGEAITPA